MTAYMISQVEVLDASQWQRYGQIAAPVIAPYGGQYLVRRAVPEVAEGDRAAPHPEGQQIIVVEFPSMEQLHKWYHSPEYAGALAVRKTAVNRRLLFVQDVDKPESA